MFSLIYLKFAIWVFLYSNAWRRFRMLAARVNRLMSSDPIDDQEGRE